MNVAGGFRLWLRWSWRDLRRRWIQLAVTALVIALGTGLFAGLQSLSRWRTLSNEASFEQTLYHDLRVQLATGSFLPQGQLLAAAANAPGLNIEAAEERLVVPAQVEVSADGTNPILVSGRMVGYDLAGGEVSVDRVAVPVGRPLDTGDQGAATALIERNFAKHYGLPPEGTVRIAGGEQLSFVGHASSPEYFLVVTEGASLLGEASFAVVFSSLTTVQRLAGLEGQVNDLVIRLPEGADADAAATILDEAVAPLGGTVLTREDEDSYRLLTRDAEGDQQVYTVFALAILLGAVFAAFNITSRMVEAQRREFGIAMALGVPPLQIALRPLLVGVQIALLGVVFGLVVGLLMGVALGAVFRDFLTIPVIVTPFQPGIFAGAAALGFLAPMAAIVYPVWRAVSVPPIRAIRTGHLAVRSPGLAGFAGRIPLPGNTFVRMPLRNLLRAPRRALLTGVAVAAIIAVLVSLLGYLDSFYDSLDRAEAETSQATPDRLEVDLDRFYPADGPEVAAILGSGIENAETHIRVAATLLGDGDPVDVLLELTPFDSPLWRPTTISGSLPSGPGIVLAEKAASDLGVKPGDTVRARLPVRQEDGSFVLTETDVEVAAVHAHPLRIQAYMDASQAPLLGLAGQTNRVTALPGDAGAEAARRALFDVPGVVAVQEAAAGPRQLRERLSEFAGVFRVLQGALFVLAALIAFNTATINLDERSREHATMLAFGIPVPRIIAMMVLEGLALGLFATLLGLAAGYVLVRWFVGVIAARTMPDLGLDIVLTPASLVTVLVLGVLAVGIAPLFGWRRLRRTDVPSTLRLME